MFHLVKWEVMKKQGKTKVIKSLNLKKPVVMVGDGYTDLEVFLHGAADVFICYTENIKRKKVISQSEFTATSFERVIEIIGVQIYTYS